VVRLDEVIRAGEGRQDAVAIDDGIFMSRGIANSYLVATDDGDVLINTGLDFEAAEIRARFDAVSDGPVRYITFTQGHPDHVGGWSHFHGPGVETVAQANHTDVREYWRRLHPFYVQRIMKLWGPFTADIDTSHHPPEPVLTRTFLDSHAFELGGRRVELCATPGGEAADSLVVWLPEPRIVFVGNLLGPMFGHVPNLYTIRGDKIRSAMAFVHSVDRVIDLAPETLVNGHDVFRGADEIRQTLTKVRDATTYLRDRTIDGMNAGTDLWTLMGQVTLPPELTLPQVHGKVPWIVRAIWEEHAGWFRYESTTELYDVPPSAVWPDLWELAGGGWPLANRARGHLEEGRPRHALHLTDIILREAPTDPLALKIKRRALEQLLAESGRENFSEVQWLESEIAEMSTAEETA
jgi:glyoxylase-like metal-dependent hydrolase (beta-lactamase superfamily II)